MFAQTHWKIGDALSRNISGLLLPVDKLAFQYGCIVPDFLFKLPDHTWEKSMSYTAALIKEIVQADPLSVSMEGKRDWFIKLGVITHYISDYFCQPHNDDPRYQKTVPHLLYENRLRFEVNIAQLAKSSRINLDRFNDFHYQTPWSLVDYINERHLAYRSEKPGMSKDIEFAVQTSSHVVAAILHYRLASKSLAA